MNIDRTWIAAHIPHQGSMCLLDRVDHWSENDIVCRASSHQLTCNPLIDDLSLGIAIGIEYAAQAVAIHGALLSKNDAGPASGFLTSARDVRWKCRTLDEVVGDLIIRAEIISGNGLTMLYKFFVGSESAEILNGRVSVILNADET